MMNRETIKSHIQELLNDHILNIEKLRKLYQDLTLFNARSTLDNNQDNVLQNVENFISYAITLYDKGYIDDWKLQLEAASAIIPV